MRTRGNAVVSGREGGHMLVGDMCVDKSLFGFLCWELVINSMSGASIILIDRFTYICLRIFEYICAYLMYI